MDKLKARLMLSKKSIQGGSHTFYLASLLLDSKSRRGAYLLYRWCRYCDDVVDIESSNRRPADCFKDLWERTTLALEEDRYDDSSPFSGLFELHHTYKIPKDLFFELLKGFEWDVLGFRPRNFDELELYCYYVAGVVGIMMSSVLGVTNTSAFSYADQLGRAMQLTNISRDIRADFENGRIYIPDDRLQYQDKNVFKMNLNDWINLVFPEVLDILGTADRYYDEGRKGLVYLPARAAWGISVASTLYQSIGKKITRKGVVALRNRTVLNSFEKVSAVVWGTFIFLKVKIRFFYGSYLKGSKI